MYDIKVVSKNPGLHTHWLPMSVMFSSQVPHCSGLRMAWRLLARTLPSGSLGCGRSSLEMSMGSRVDPMRSTRGSMAADAGSARETLARARMLPSIVLPERGGPGLNSRYRGRKWTVRFRARRCCRGARRRPGPRRGRAGSKPRRLWRSGAT